MSHDALLAYLGISTWRGLSPEAIHYYGTVRFETRELSAKKVLGPRELAYKPDERVRLERQLDAAEARALNKKDSGTSWHAGSSTGRFNSEADVIKAAIAEWKRDPRGTRALCQRDDATCEPRIVLAGPANLIRKSKRLRRLYDAVPDIWEVNPRLGEKLYDEWCDLVGKARVKWFKPKKTKAKR